MFQLRTVVVDLGFMIRLTGTASMPGGDVNGEDSRTRICFLQSLC